MFKYNGDIISYHHLYIISYRKKIWSNYNGVAAKSQKRTKVEKKVVFPYKKSGRWNGSYWNDTRNAKKKTEIVTSWGRWSKNDLFLTFFPEIMKIPKRKIRLMKKRNYKNDTFLVIFGVFLRTGFFIGNGLIDAKKLWSSL